MTTSQLKALFLTGIAENAELAGLLAAGDESVQPDTLLGTHVFPFLKFDAATLGTPGCYLGLRLDYTATEKNDLYRRYSLSAYILCHYSLMDTDTGATRIDRIAELLDEMWTWSRPGGFSLSLTSDTEDIYNDNYVFRRMVFSSVTASNMAGGVKYSDG